MLIRKAGFKMFGVKVSGKTLRKNVTRQQGSHLREKTAFFMQKKSRLRKSEDAVRLLYAKNPVTSHIKMRLVFLFFAPSREGL